MAANTTAKGRKINLMNMKDRMRLVLLLREKKDHFTNRLAADIAADAAKELGVPVTKWNVKCVAEIAGVKLRQIRRHNGSGGKPANSRISEIMEGLAVINANIESREKDMVIMANQIFALTARLDNLEAKVNEIGRETGVGFH